MDNNQLIIDVREPDEFQSESVPGSTHLPLSRLDNEAPQLMKSIVPGQKIVLMCKSGKRAVMAEQRLRQLGLTTQGQCSVFEGGILEWKRRGGAINSRGGAINSRGGAVNSRGGAIKQSDTKATKVLSVPPVMQQVQITIGTLVILSSILSAFVSLNFLVIPLAIGTGLLAAGLSGRCVLAAFLSKMPWNKNV